MELKLKKLYLLLLLIPIGVLTSSDLSADFFSMPEITEMPKMERKSLLKDLDIPSVRDRDPDPQAGPRLNVERFKIEGIVEFPELGITKSDIDKLIEGIRFDLMQEFEVQESGFTKKELAEVSKLLVEIEEETQDRHVSELEVQRLIWLVREQRSKRGVTLGQIETVADRITRFYRERGFILAKAYIPQQQVRDGIVTLSVLLGTLGEVDVQNNKIYKSNVLTSAFDDLLTLPVTDKLVEENLYLINDFPGVIATGFFQPGTQVGDTKLSILVKNERKYDANIRFDNHGSELTGQYRVYAEGLWHNPLGNADQLKLAVLKTVDPENSTYYQLRYSSRVFSPRFDLGIGRSSNDFVLGQGNNETINDLGIFGETTQTDITATYRFKRSRTASYYGDIIYNEIESQLRLGAVGGAEDDRLDDVVSNLSFVFRFDVLNEESKALHQGDISLLSGSFDKGAEDGQDKNYYVLGVNYSLLTFWQVPLLDLDTRLIYRGSGQFASSSLSSINQFSLAGPTRSRGYQTNQFSADNALYFGVDWIFNAPEFMDIDIGDSNWRKILSPYLFVDASWGEVVSLIDGTENSTGQLVDVGVGVQYSYRNQISGNLQLAFPVDESFSDDTITVPNDSIRVVFDFQYSFM